MGMFDFLKKKKNAEEIGAPIEGEVVTSAEIPDPVFSEEMMGKGVAIKPTGNKIYAPADASVEMIFDTKHAITLKTTGGVEILIHVGLDTVSLGGTPFDVKVETGANVKKGDLLMEVDMDAIKEAGLEVITPVVICNADDFKGMERFTGKQVKPGDAIMELEK